MAAMSAPARLAPHEPRGASPLRNAWTRPSCPGQRMRSKVTRYMRPTSQNSEGGFVLVTAMLLTTAPVSLLVPGLGVNVTVAPSIVLTNSPRVIGLDIVMPPLGVGGTAWSLPGWPQLTGAFKVSQPSIP